MLALEWLDMKICIAGQPKTGTTALYHQIRSAVPEAVGVFEPTYEQLARAQEVTASTGRDLVIKVVLNEASAHRHWLPLPSEQFDKGVLLQRDPRDTLVSLLLFLPRSYLYSQPGALATFLDLVRRKEDNPAAIDFSDLIDLFNRLVGRQVFTEFITRQHYGLGWRHTRPEFFLFRYEDLVAGRTAALSDYLGLALPSEFQLAKNFSFVARTKQAGSWRHWFTEHDVALWRSELTPFLAAMGYKDDWQLADTPQIPAEHGSGDIEKIVADMRQRRPRWRAQSALDQLSSWGKHHL